MQREKLISEAINQAISQTPSIIPAIPEVAGMMQTDLYQGPIYLSPDGEMCEHADEGAVAFDFNAGVEIMRDWKGELPTLYIDNDSGCVSETNPFDDPANYEDTGTGASIYLGPETVYEVTPSEIVCNLLGNALAENI